MKKRGFKLILALSAFLMATLSVSRLGGLQPRRSGGTPIRPPPALWERLNNNRSHHASMFSHRWEEAPETIVPLMIA